MANLQYSSDLLENILFRLDEPTDGTSDYDAQALICLNRAYMALCAGGSELDEDVDEDWWWLKADAPGVLTLNADVTGTASLTNGSASVTLSATPSRNLLGHVFRVTGEADVYRVSAHTGTSTSLTLDSAFTGTTNAAAAFTAQQLLYNLSSSVLKITQPMRCYRDNQNLITGIDQNELDRSWPLYRLWSGTPQNFCMIDQDTVRFSHSPPEAMRVEYEYLEYPTMLTDNASEEPLVPLKHRRLLTDYACMFLAQDKEDSRFEQFGLMAKSGLRSMVKEQRRSAMRQKRPEFGKIYPRQGQMQDPGPLRTSSGLIIG